MDICLLFSVLAARVWYTSAMRESMPEPGFVQAYRLFVAIRIMFWLVVGPVLVLIELAGNPSLSPEQVASQPLVQQLAFPNIAPLLFLEVLLLGLLSWPRPRTAWDAGLSR